MDHVRWEKDGTVMRSGDLRRKFFDNGTLIINRVVKEADEGGYVCTATSRGGQSALATTVLRVIGKHPAFLFFRFFLFFAGQPVVKVDYWNCSGTQSCAFFRPRQFAAGRADHPDVHGGTGGLAPQPPVDEGRQGHPSGGVKVGQTAQL